MSGWQSGWGKAWSEGWQSAARGSTQGRGKGQGRGPEGQKPTDDPNFVTWTEGMRLVGSGLTYVVEAYVASGTFSRVFRVRSEGGNAESSTARRWGKSQDAEGAGLYAAKIMRQCDAYIQYSSNGPKEGQLLQQLEKAQRDAGQEVLTMRCFDSFATKDSSGNEYWCLILEWLPASLFDVVKANSNRGLHLSLVRTLLQQLCEQLSVLQGLSCTHTDIKHKNCCLADTEHYFAPGKAGQPTLVLTRPSAKFIDYGNAVFEGDAKTHPIHTKQFRAPEVLLNSKEGWGPASDTWTLGITAAFLISGQLIFNSHDPHELVRKMTEALGPFPRSLLDASQDSKMRRAAEAAAREASQPAPPRAPPRALARLLGLEEEAKVADSPEEACVDLLARMLELEPKRRISAAEALLHPFLANDGVGSLVKAAGKGGR